VSDDSTSTRAARCGSPDPTSLEPARPETALAVEIRRLRAAAGLSQNQLADAIGYTRQYVSRAERLTGGCPSAELVRVLDTELSADGALIALHAQLLPQRTARRKRATHVRGAGSARSSSDPTSVTCATPLMAPVSAASSSVGTTPRYSRPVALNPVRGREPAIAVDGHTNDGEIRAPAGRFFSGTVIPFRAVPARDDGRILATVPTGFVDDAFIRHPRRRLVVGITPESENQGMFAMDARQARRRLNGAPDHAPLLMPRAYALDDLTLGLLWAVSNLDEALLDDDAALARCTGHAHTYERLPRSAAGREIAADLAPVSQMWLGSQFCASHILRHTNALAAAPRFWTREQRGEEASTWLLFAHKFAYLQRSTGNGEHIAVRRAFCVPASVVADSHRTERILLLLAMALMESFGIAVDVCAEPEYAAVSGFVVDGHRTAITANWVGTDGIWQVDVTGAPPLLREFTDATGFAQAHSVIAADSAGGRIRATAEYLDLDWSWLSQRSAELGEYGSGGIVAPRSRLLSTDGVDRACRFLAATAVTAR